jgi:hypothetical protein
VFQFLAPCCSAAMKSMVKTWKAMKPRMNVVKCPSTTVPSAAGTGALDGEYRTGVSRRQSQQPSQTRDRGGGSVR